MRAALSAAWHEAVSGLATVVWRGRMEEDELEMHEYAWSSQPVPDAQE
jgi:hypothetical protein